MPNFSLIFAEFAGNIWHIAKKSAKIREKLGQKEPENKMSAEPKSAALFTD